MAEHELKIWPSFYRAVVDGTKRFEVRRNDRDFAVGDVLVLREWSPAAGGFTGSALVRRVSYVLDGWHCLGIELGFVVMGIEEAGDGEA